MSSGSPSPAGAPTRRWGSPSTAGPSTGPRPGSVQPLPQTLAPQPSVSPQVQHVYAGPVHRAASQAGTNGGLLRTRTTSPGHSSRGSSSTAAPAGTGQTMNAAMSNAAAAARVPSEEMPKFVSRNASPSASPQRPGSASSSSSEDPDNTCAICLGKPSNKSFTDACYHPFCFSCLVEWSRVKATCPLCQKPFRTIVHNIKENYEFEQYHIFQHLRVPPGAAASTVRGTSQTPFPSTSTERRGIYEMGYYARPSGYARYREISAEFYLNNPAQTHRLIPWLNRELVALLPPSQSVSLVLELILAVICRVDIRSPEMRHVLEMYLRPYTAHFQHEFYCFASSPHDMVMYDRNVEYEYRPPLSYHEAVDRLRRAFERETLERLQRGVGNGVVPRLGAAEPGTGGQSAFRPWSPQPGPSRVVPTAPPIAPTTGSPQPSTSGTQSNCAASSGNDRGTLVIVSSSDDSSDNDDEANGNDEDCQIVKVIKPYRERTPVLIDLCGDTTDSESSEADTIPAEGPGEPPAEPSKIEDVSTSTDEDTGSEDEDDNVARGRRKSIIGAYYPGRASETRGLRSPQEDFSGSSAVTGDGSPVPPAGSSAKMRGAAKRSRGKERAKVRRSRSRSSRSRKSKRQTGRIGTSSETDHR